jgi:hypothetical protein
MKNKSRKMNLMTEPREGLSEGRIFMRFQTCCRQALAGPTWVRLLTLRWLACIKVDPHQEILIRSNEKKVFSTDLLPA